MSNESPSYFDDFRYFNDPEYVRRVVSANFDVSEIAGRRVLDFGCGTGDAAHVFATNGASSVLGVDIGRKNIDACRKQCDGLANVTFERADLNALAIGTARFDIIWSDTVVELLDRRFNEVAVATFAALAPGGAFYVSTPEATFLNRAIAMVVRLSHSPVAGLVLRLAEAYLRLRYRLAGVQVDGTVFRDKLRYLSVPVFRPVSRREVVRSLANAGFTIEYVRLRIKSDVNSPPHLEARARKPAEFAS